MEDHGRLEALLPAKRLYFGQYALLSLIKTAVLLLGLNTLIRLITTVVFFPPVLWIVLNLTAAALAAVYFYINQPGELQFARWLDVKLNSKERLQTLFELEQPPHQHPTAGKTGHKKTKDAGGTAGPFYQIQTTPEMRALIMEETFRYLSAHPPAVKLDHRLFRYWLPRLLAALLICTGTLYISPALSQLVSRGQGLKIAQQEATREIAELEELLSEEPLLEELLAELALAKQQLEESKSPDEVALSLQEVRELLAEYAEKLEEVGQAYQLPEELLSANGAAEIASDLQEDPRFNHQLLDSLQGLQNRLFQLSSAGALELKEGLSRIEQALAKETDIATGDVEDLLGVMEQLDPASARAAVQAGLKQLGAGSGSGQSSLGAGSKGSGNPTNNNNSNNSGNPSSGGSQREQNQGEGTGQGPGNSGENTSGTGSSGKQSGSGASGEGSGQTGSGTGGSSGSGAGSGDGQGAGAGTGSGALSEQQFYFIPGDRQVSLSGTGEEGSYTWQELLKYNPELIPEDLSPYYDSYYHQGIGSINRGQVPQPLENYLRAYFQAITPPSPH